MLQLIMNYEDLCYNLTIASMHPKFTDLGVEISQDPLKGVIKEIGNLFDLLTLFHVLSSNLKHLSSSMAEGISSTGQKEATNTFPH